MTDLRDVQGAAQLAAAEGKTRFVIGTIGLLGVAIWTDPNADLGGAFDAIDADTSDRYAVRGDFEINHSLTELRSADYGLQALSPRGNA